MYNRILSLCAAALMVIGASAQTRLSGSITDTVGAAVPFADVVLGEQHFHVAADERGAFRVGGLWPGAIPVHIARVGFVTLDSTVLLLSGENVIAFRLHADVRTLNGIEVSALRAGDRSPFAKTTISKEELAPINTGVDLPYLLEQQPGVVTTSDGGTGIGYTYMRIRGSDGARTNVTVNGVPFNDPESQGAFFVDLPDIASSAEDIEIQRGVGTSTNGPGAFGASVNVRTTAVRREAWGLVSATAGSYNTQRYSVSAGTGLLPASAEGASRFSLDMRLSSITSDGYIDRASADLKSYFLQGAWIGKNRSLRFITFRGKEVTYQAWDGVPREVIDTNRTYNGSTYDNQVDNYDQAHYQLLFDQRIGKNATLDLTLFRVIGAGYYEQFRQDDDLATYGISPAVINGDTISSTDLIRRRWLSSTLSGANASAEIQLGRHRLVFGGSYSEYEGEHYGEVIWSRYAGSTDIRHRYYDDDASKTDANAFAKFTYVLNEHFDLYADGQVRHVDYSFLGFNNALENVTQTVRWIFFNPKAGVLWRVRRGDKVYASFAVGNHEPNRDDLEETTPTSRPRSERLMDYELGAEHRNGRFSMGINGYYMNYVDQLVLTGELNDVGAALRTNVKSSYRAGVELMFATQITKRLQWRANATLSSNKVRNYTEFVDDWDNGGQAPYTYSTSDLAFSPAVILGSELAYRVWDKEKKGRADITFVTKYVGDQYLDNSASAEQMLKAYVVNDLRANVTLFCLKGAKSVDLNFTVRNLFSELYESNGWVYSYIADGRRQEQVGLFPQAPVNVLGAVTVRF